MPCRAHPFRVPLSGFHLADRQGTGDRGLAVGQGACFCRKRTALTARDQAISPAAVHSSFWPASTAALSGRSARAVARRFFHSLSQLPRLRLLSSPHPLRPKHPSTQERVSSSSSLFAARKVARPRAPVRNPQPATRHPPIHSALLGGSLHPASCSCRAFARARLPPPQIRPTATAADPSDAATSGSRPRRSPQGMGRTRHASLLDSLVSRVSQRSSSAAD